MQADPADPGCVSRSVLPPVFRRVRWVGQTSVCPAENLVGLCFKDAAGARHDLAVDVDQLRAIVARLVVHQPMTPLWAHELNELRAIGAPAAPADREGYLPITYANVNRVWPGGQMGLILKAADGQRWQFEISLRSWLNFALAGAAEIDGSVVTYAADGAVVIPSESELEKRIRFAYLAYEAGRAPAPFSKAENPHAG